MGVDYYRVALQIRASGNAADRVNFVTTILKLERRHELFADAGVLLDLLASNLLIIAAFRC